MQSVGMDDVGSALLITAGLSVVMIAIVVLAMWWVFAVFKDKKSKSDLGKDSKKDSSQNTRE
jgi:hypothetical protein